MPLLEAPPELPARRRSAIASASRPVELDIGCPLKNGEASPVGGAASRAADDASAAAPGAEAGAVGVAGCDSPSSASVRASSSASGTVRGKRTVDLDEEGPTVSSSSPSSAILMSMDT